MKYKTILADPPWNERGGGKIKRGADKHYNLMKTSDIISMAPFVSSLSGTNCHLYLWTTNSFLPDALQVMSAWGFKYITTITWLKGSIGLGQYFRGATEHCLFGRKGILPYKTLNGKRQQGSSGFYAPKTLHSAKPERMFEMIEKVSYPQRMELFSRKKREGWDSWGDEAL